MDPDPRDLLIVLRALDAYSTMVVMTQRELEARVNLYITLHGTDADPLTDENSPEAVAFEVGRLTYRQAIEQREEET